MRLIFHEFEVRGWICLFVYTFKRRKASSSVVISEERDGEGKDRSREEPVDRWTGQEKDCSRDGQVMEKDRKRALARMPLNAVKRIGRDACTGAR